MRSLPTPTASRFEVGKKVTPAQIPALPGQIAVTQLTAKVKPFPDSTVDARQIIITDPEPLAEDEWFNAFSPNSITATAIPADATLTVQYWDGSAWIDVSGLIDIAGPTIVNQALPASVHDVAQGLRFVYTSTATAPEGFPPGTAVSPNYTSSLRPNMANSDEIIRNCAGSSAVAESLVATADPVACDDIELIPVDPGTIDPI